MISDIKLRIKGFLLILISFSLVFVYNFLGDKLPIAVQYLGIAIFCLMFFQGSEMLFYRKGQFLEIMKSLFGKENDNEDQKENVIKNKKISLFTSIYNQTDRCIFSVILITSFAFLTS